MTLLRQGSRGAAVQTLQQNLNSIGGYSLVTDGIFGALTKSAVIDFQRRNRLVTDGIVGIATNRAINESLNQSAPAPIQTPTVTTSAPAVAPITSKPPTVYNVIPTEPSAPASDISEDNTLIYAGIVGVGLYFYFNKKKKKKK